MTKASEQAAKILLSIGAVTLNPKKPYRYVSGILSPVYTDCRLLMSFPTERSEIVTLLCENLKSKGSFDVVAGTATAGIPHAAWVAQELGLPMIYARNKPKDHGKGNLIEGLLKKGQKVAVIEDLISTGQSSAVTVNAVREQGAKSDTIFSIITYGLSKADETFKSNKIELLSLTNLSDLSKIASENNYIAEKDNEMVLEWAKDPTSWGSRMGFE